MQSTVDDAPCVRFVNKVLRDSVRRGATCLRFERHPKMKAMHVKALENGAETPKVEMWPTGEYSWFSILMEIDGKFEVTAGPPVALWERIIRRLKVMSRMVDHGPYKSVNGYLNLQTEGNNQATFFVTTNPDPTSDNAVILQYKGTVSR